MSASPNPPLYGLVMAGGRSSRMGQDKAVLDYAGKPQVCVCAELLGSVVDEVFVSGGDRADAPEFESFNLIADDPAEIGPMGGILGALHRNPEAAWLVIACDLPLLDDLLLRELIRGRDPERRATIFMAGDGMLEPLCGIYEPGMAAVLEEHVARKDYSLRHALNDSNVRLLCLESEEKLRNVNTPEEFSAVKNRISSGEGGN